MKNAFFFGRFLSGFSKIKLFRESFFPYTGSYKIECDQDLINTLKQDHGSERRPQITEKEIKKNFTTSFNAIGEMPFR